MEFNYNNVFYLTQKEEKTPFPELGSFHYRPHLQRGALRGTADVSAVSQAAACLS